MDISRTPDPCSFTTRPDTSAASATLISERGGKEKAISAISTVCPAENDGLGSRPFVNYEYNVNAIGRNRLGGNSHCRFRIPLCSKHGFQSFGCFRGLLQ